MIYREIAVMVRPYRERERERENLVRWKSIHRVIAFAAAVRRLGGSRDTQVTEGLRRIELEAKGWPPAAKYLEKKLSA